jgi:glycerol-3-phosphate dehydrogenase
VIGGGITGAGVARDAALRGLSCLLLEKGDFASGVTSKSTRLIHGGLRYLANFEMDLVAESLRERAILRNQAPYLVHPMPILIPIYKGDPHGRALISLGIHLYDLLSHEKDIPHYFTSNCEKTLRFEPRLSQDGLKGSALFYDHQILMPERLVIENIISAREAGATLLNYTKAEQIEESSLGVIVTAKDMLTSATAKFRSRVLINAAGPWIDSVRRAGSIDQAKIIFPSKGIHLILPKLTEQALFVTSRDGRMFFIIPLGAYSLIGTTDNHYEGDLDNVYADRNDVEYLLNESRRILPHMNLSKDAIFHTYAGIRPLAFCGKDETKISRKHRVIQEGEFKRIITIAGGKLTTYRNMAKDVVNTACAVLGVRAQCVTDKKPLAGGLLTDYARYLQETVPEWTDQYKVSSALVRHLIGVYGSRTEKVLEIIRQEPALGAQISPEGNDVYAEVLYGVVEEAAQTVSDLVLRRLPLGITATRGRDQAEKIAAIIGKELRWNNDEKEYHIAEFKKMLDKDTACLKA